MHTIWFRYEFTQAQYLYNLKQLIDKKSKRTAFLSQNGDNETLQDTKERKRYN